MAHDCAWLRARGALRRAPAPLPQDPRRCPGLERDLVRLLDEAKVKEAREKFSRGEAMEERVLADALEVYDRGPTVVEQTMLSSLARERRR
ncbi:MAG: hypothetical protein R3F43_09425 [bacterium]